MSPSELNELRRQLKELLEVGFIKPSKALYGALILFQKKYDGLLCLCINYQALNKVTTKNKYPIPLFADLFDQLGHAKYFSKLDLRSGYYQVWIAEGDKPKTACVTHYGAFELKVMPNTLEEHAEHLRIIFRVLQENELYVKREKCSFAKLEVEFLSHKTIDEKLIMDKAKVKAIAEWEAPTKVMKLLYFLGLVNYYRRFIKDFSTIAAPLTDFLKKAIKWEWTVDRQHAFDSLKWAIIEESVLALPNHAQPF
ncbi:uncharacterized protein LOC116107459 [Pistacia vera]|uniref:uncharacterized protein LOC116107459 n=1 Tax=Pistacia vera TaxID=55513 RepID=UPI0012635393|nr:uncharacterized protein LOC116107459 [Pistacia vera]